MTSLLGPFYSPKTWWRTVASLTRRRSDPLSESGYSHHAVSSPGTVLFAAPSSHGNGIVLVVQHGPWRCLLFDDVEQGICYTRSGTPDPSILGFQYLRVMAAAALCFQPSKSILCIGLGSGALPAYLAALLPPQTSLLTVEIDPVVALAAAEFLNAGLDVVVDDAASYVARAPPTSIDVVFMDAYDRMGSVPEHLTKRDFLTSCREKLRDGGVLVANVFNGKSGSKTRCEVGEFVDTLKEVVGPCFTVRVKGQEHSLVVVARKGEALTPPELAALRETVRGAGMDDRLIKGLLYVDPQKGFKEWKDAGMLKAATSACEWLSED